MDIDETGEDVHALRIDHALGSLRLCGRGPAGIECGNAIAFDDDVDRSGRRRSAAFDHGSPADKQSVEGAFAFAGGTIGHALHLRGERLAPQSGKRRQCQCPSFHRYPLKSATVASGCHGPRKAGTFPFSKP